MSDASRMSELLCTRLCHDLTGPIGAVSNGAEFLSDEGFSLQADAVDLIVSSAFSAVSRLQFYRFAYGRMKDSGEVSLADKRAMADAFLQGSNLTLDWPDTHTDAAPFAIGTQMVRLIFNLLIISSESLLKGGTLSVRLEEGEQGAHVIRVRAAGEMVKWDPDIGAILSKTSDAPMTPKNIQHYVTAILADELHVKIAIEADSTAVAFAAVQSVQSA